MSPGSVNFPENLEIFPSTYPTLSQISWTPIENSIFGYTAQLEAIGKYGIAGKIWEAAYALNLYINPPPNIIFDPPFMTRLPALSSDHPFMMLELGSGLGMTSSLISKILRNGDVVIATDLPEVCPLLEKNLKTGRGISLDPSAGASQPLVVVRPFVWGNDSHGKAILSEFSGEAERTLTHVICSDLVYFPELLGPLLRSLLQVTSPPFSQFAQNDVTVILSYKPRSLSKETPFWAAFGLWFTFEPVLAKDISAEDTNWRRFGISADDTNLIFVAHRRVKSFAWNIPADDGDLLAGKGAWGNNSTKSDDSFETLLFMTLDGY